MRAKDEYKFLEEAYTQVHTEEYDKEEDYWTTYFKKGDRIKFHTGREFQVGGTVEDVGRDAVLVRDEHGETLAVWKKNITEVLPDEDGERENPDAHTYNKKGRMAGPAAELDPNIGFNNEEEGNETGGPSPLTGPDEPDPKPPFKAFYDPDKSKLGKAFNAARKAKGARHRGSYDLGPDREEER